MFKVLNLFLKRILQEIFRNSISSIVIYKLLWNFIGIKLNEIQFTFRKHYKEIYNSNKSRTRIKSYLKFLY